MFFAVSASLAAGVELAGKTKIRENIAVIDFEGKDVSASEASIFTDFLRTELVKTGTFNVVDKTNMEKILREVAFQQTGVTSTEDAAKMGQILNVRKMVIGSVARLGNAYFVTANLVDVESAKIDRSETLRSDNIDALPDTASTIAERFSGVVVIERMAVVRKIVLVISPKIGVFYPLDQKVSRNHGAGLLYGFDLSFWQKRHGLAFMYDQYSNTNDVPTRNATHVENRINEEYVGPITTEKLTIQSFTMGYDFKFSDSGKSFVYAGAGIGKLWSKLNGEASGSTTFDTYYLTCAIKRNTLGMCLKYSFTPTNSKWDDVNFRAITASINYNFMTTLNLF